MVAVDVSLTGVAAKLIVFSDSSRAGRIPTPLQGSLYVLEERDNERAGEVIIPKFLDAPGT
jgi:hypothetical protein